MKALVVHVRGSAPWAGRLGTNSYVGRVTRPPSMEMKYLRVFESECRECLRPEFPLVLTTKHTQASNVTRVGGDGWGTCPAKNKQKTNSTCKTRHVKPNP